MYPIPRAARTHDRLATALLSIALLIGLAERIGWAFLRRTPWTMGEAPNVAIALARGRGFSDAFWDGQGPTAHLLPISPAIAGAVYALLGIRTPLAEAVLCLWSIGLSLGTYALLYATFARLGTPRWARLGALIFLLVAPIYTTNEVFEFRIWEGGLGLFLGTLLLWLLVRVEAGERPRRFGLWLAILPALAFFVNPPIGLAAYLAWAVHVWRHRRRPRALATAALATGLALAALVGPWAARNMATMGHPILLRDDLGMEIAVANYPQAVSGVDRDGTFLRRLQTIQPYIHPVAQRALLAAGGEVAYSQALGREAKAWIAANPRDFLTLCRRHLGEMMLPGTWMFMTSHGVNLPAIRAGLVRAVHVLGFVGLIAALWRRDRRYAYILPFAVIPVLVYVPFQPIIRYTWLVYAVLAYCGADLIARVAARRSFSGGAR